MTNMISSIAQEFHGALLGDERRSRRLVELAESAASNPSASFPTMASNDSELEATYRFLGNEHVSATQMLGPHRRQTAKRAAATKQVIVAHDTTEFNFGKKSRKDLGRVGRGKSYGFYAHFALAITADEMREPLGIVAMKTHSRSGNKGKRTKAEMQSTDDNEFFRWREVFRASEKELRHLQPINVMDREADCYSLFAEMIAKKSRFVIRMAHSKRRLEDGGTVAESLITSDILACREVPISRRGSSSMPNKRRIHPPRIARMASLKIASKQVTICRPISASKTLQETLSLNVVHVFESDPPEGEPAVEWRLWTTEPVETAGDVLMVVDAYRARWRIEEYFKALKSGCGIVRRQLETEEALVRALALFVPIAWKLLLLRATAHRGDNTLAEKVISPRQLLCLKFAITKLKKKELPDSPTAMEALFAIASLGGHLRRNGPPGWQTLWRGYEKLLDYEEGFTFALDM